MDFKLLFSFLFVSSCVFVGFSQNDSTAALFDNLQGSLGTNLDTSSLDQSLQAVMIQGTSIGSGSMPCVQKLLPCQPFLNSPDTPTATCCLPLKEMLANDTRCLCDIFDNPEILKSLNVTQDHALKLPKACGAKADISVCKKGATPPTTSPATPSITPETPSNSSSSTSNSTNSSSPASAAYGISHFGGSGFVAFFVGLIISAF